MAVRTWWEATHTQLHTYSTENLGRTCPAMPICSVTSVRGLSQASGFPPAAVAKIAQFALFGVILLPPFHATLGFSRAFSPQIENHCSRLKAFSHVCAAPLTQILLSAHIHATWLDALDVQDWGLLHFADSDSPAKISTRPVPALRDQGA